MKAAYQYTFCKVKAGTVDRGQFGWSELWAYDHGPGQTFSPNR